MNGNGADVVAGRLKRSEQSGHNLAAHSRKRIQQDVSLPGIGGLSHPLENPRNDDRSGTAERDEGRFALLGRAL